MKFTKDQINAIESNKKNLRIIACAGSGKTSTVAAKVAFLINPNTKPSVSPQNIIAFTYTDRAAAELKNKILSFIKNQKTFADIDGLADMYVGTIHGWCLKALQENEYEYQKFSVLDEIKLKLFVDKCYNIIGMKDIFKINDNSIVMKKYVDTGRFIQLMNIIRESDIRGGLPPNIQTAKDKYETTLYNNRYFDFTMIMTETLKKLKGKKQLYKKIKRDLKYLIVDEYQDINPIQEKLIKQLYSIAKPTITVVGDDDQNIYQWRGSNNKFIKEFTNTYSPAEEVILKKNFRSSRGITSLSETLISVNDRIPKSMESANTQKFVKKEDVLYNEFKTIRDENKYIAKTIKKLLGAVFKDNKDNKARGLDYSDFSILLRAWRKTESIVEVLNEYNIPYITAGVNQLFDVAEVQAALGIFHHLSGDLDSKDLFNAWVRLPKIIIDKQKLKNAIDILDEKSPNKYIDRKGKPIWAYSLQEIYWGFLEDAEITENIFSDPNTAEIIMYNLGKFSQVINDFEVINFNSTPPASHLRNFLNFIFYAAKDYYPEGWLNNPYKTPSAVQIMTVHQAKGLEFPVVFIPGLNKNYLPSKKHGGLSEWHFLSSSLIKNYNRYVGDIQDERRLFYVAITRSQKYLFITRAPDQNNRLYKKPSIFVDEITNSNIIVSNLPDYKNLDKQKPKPKEEAITITLNFSVLKDFFECNYRFKLISMYGFSYPLNQRMGFGKSLHNSLMEIHKRSMLGEKLKVEDVERISLNQSHFPYLGKSIVLDRMKELVNERILEYYEKNKSEFKNIEFVEQDIQLSLDDGIFINGTIDLVRKKTSEDKYETTIIEFKSNEDVQKSTVTYDQLSLYALGHKELTGETADYIQIYDLENNLQKPPQVVDSQLLISTENKILGAAQLIRKQKFKRINNKNVCRDCHQYQLCFSGLVYKKK